MSRSGDKIPSIPVFTGVRYGDKFVPYEPFRGQNTLYPGVYRGLGRGQICPLEEFNFEKYFFRQFFLKLLGPGRIGMRNSVFGVPFWLDRKKENGLQ